MKKPHASQKSCCLRFAKIVRKHGNKCLKQGRKIYKKLNEVDESVNIIACELARQLKEHGR